MRDPRGSAQCADVGDAPPADIPAELHAVYDREVDFVWRTIRRLGVPDADVPDAVHDVFAVVVRRWADYDPSRPLRGWLFGIARRVAASTRRRLPRIPERTSELPEPGASPESQAASRELLVTLLDCLDDDKRVAFILHDLEGFSGAEIADMLGVSTATVQSRIRLARERLAALVKRMRLRRAI